MFKPLQLRFALCVSLLIAGTAHAAWREEALRVDSTRAGVSVELLIAQRAEANQPAKKFAQPTTDLVLFFPGGGGMVRPPREGLREHEERKSILGLMAEKIGATVVVGLPSDQTKAGLSLEWRTGIEHVADAGAVIDTLTGKNANARVTLIGMSNGARSVTHVASALARRGAPKLAGVVLMAAAGEAFPDTAMDALKAAKVPVLVVHHKRDSCLLYVDMEPFAKWHDFLTIDDTKHPRINGVRRECGNESAHQFAGKEDIVFTAVADWLKTGKLKETFL
jgi:pimeloyl-ACP methyl ester carboxylesterase